MSLREYNALKKEYRRKHGKNPPKGTKLDQLRKMLGQRSSAGTRKRASNSSSTTRSGQTSIFNNPFGRGGWR